MGLRAVGEHLELCISDNGTGMPEGLDIAEAKSLGLRIVFVLVRRLEAEVKIERGRGTTFRITLPLHAHALVEPGETAM